MSDWWNKNAQERNGDLLAWLGDVGAISRAIVRDHVVRRGYHSILDVGCGPAIEHVGYQNLRYPIEYHGVDTCELFVNAARDRNLEVRLSESQHLPFGDQTIEVVYARHVLEHLHEPELTLTQMLRVARREVIVTFFLPPGIEDEISSECDGDLQLYHNRWSHRRLCRHIWSHDQVRRVSWQPVNEETILFVELAQ